MPNIASFLFVLFFFLEGLHENFVFGGDCTRPSSVGLEKLHINDSDVTASTRHKNYPAFHGRLNYQGMWCAKTRDKNQWIQVTLHHVTKLVFLAIQGGGNGAWIQSFYIQFSLDNVTWYCYGSPEAYVMNGNTDANTIRYSTLVPAIYAQYIRVNPQSWVKDICLRLDWYGCNLNATEKEPFGFVMGESCLIKQVTSTAQVIKTTTAPVQVFPLTPIRIRIPPYIRTNHPTIIAMYPHFGTDPTYRWNMGDGHVKVTMKRYFFYSYKLAGIYNVRVNGTNSISEQTSSNLIVVQDEIHGLKYLGGAESVLPASLFNISWQLTQGTNASFRLTFGDGSTPVVKHNLGPGLYHHGHIYKNVGLYNISIAAINMVGQNTTLYGKILARFPIINNISTSIKLPRGSAQGGLQYYICVGDEITVFAKALVKGFSKCWYNFNDTDKFLLSPTHRYMTTGVSTPIVACKNNISSLSKSLGLKLIVQHPDPIEEMSITSKEVSFGNPVAFLLNMSRGKCFVCKWDFGDGTKRETDFSHLGSVLHHNYTDGGEYNVSVQCSNKNSTVVTSLIARAHIPIIGLKIWSPNTSVPSYFNTSFIVSVTEGSYVNYTIDFEDGCVISIKLPAVVKEHVLHHSFVKPGTYNVSVTAYNAISSQLSHVFHPITVQHSLKGIYISSNTPIKLSDGTAHFVVNKEGNSPNPTNATCWWDFGDGTNKTTDLKFNNNSSLELTHLFTQQKTYVITVLCLNLVSEINLKEKVYVYKTLAPVLTAGITIREVHCLSEGNTSSVCYFELGAIIFFKITSQALDRQYLWSIQNSFGNLTFATREPYFIHHFLTTGDIHFKATVSNPLIGLVSCTLRINIQQKINLASFIYDNFTSLRSPTNFRIILKDFGTDACHVLDLGDGNYVVLGMEICRGLTASYRYRDKLSWLKTTDPNITYSHYYNSEGDYNVSLHSANKISSIYKNVFVRVNKPPCRVLHINITANNSAIVASGRDFNFTRASSFLFNFSYSMDCRLAEGVTLKWSVWMTNITEMHLKSMSNVLHVLSHTFEYGRYKLIASVVPQGNDVVSLYNNTELSKNIYVSIVPSIMIAVIKGGLSRTVGYRAIFSLDGSSSYDPDVMPGEVDKDLIYEWYCNLINRKIGHSSNCFDLDYKVPFSTKAKISMQTATFDVNSVYNFQLVITKQGRQASYKQSVIVDAGEPPTMELRCKVNCARRIVPTSDLILTSRCTNCLSGTKLLYRWIISVHNSSWRNLTLPLSYTSTRSTMANFVVRKGFFTAGRSYRIQLHTWKPGGRRTVNMLTRDTNTAPENGTCTATPSNGEAMSTYFKVACLGWSDDDQPLSYNFMYENTDGTNTLYSGPKQNMVSLLPLGDFNSNNSLKIVIEVRDALGSIATNTLEVKVNEPAKVNYNSLLSSISNIVIRYLVSSTNKKKVLRQFIILSSFLNTLSKKKQEKIDHDLGSRNSADRKLGNNNCTLDGNGTSNNFMCDHGKDSNYGLSEKEKEEREKKKKKERNQRMKIREKVLVHVSQIPVMSVSDLLLTSNVIKVLTNNTNELSYNAQKTALNFLPVMTDVLKRMSKLERSGNRIEQIGRRIIQSLNGIVKATLVSQQENKKQEHFQKVPKIIAEILHDISISIGRHKVVGEYPTLIESENLSLGVQKVGDATNLNGKTFNFSCGVITLPHDIHRYMETSKDKVIIAHTTEFPRDVFQHSISTEKINSTVISLELSDDSGNPIRVRDLENDMAIIMEHKNEILTKTDTVTLQERATHLNKNHKSIHVFTREQNDSSITIDIVTQKPLSNISWFLTLYEGSLSGSPLINVTATAERFTGGHLFHTKFFIAKSNINYNGRYYLEIDVDVPDAYKESWYAGNLSVRYSLQVYESSCYYWDEGTEEWSTRGCRVEKSTGGNAVYCLCDHLTAFATGLSTLSNKVIFLGNTFAFTTSAQQVPLVFSIIIVCFGLYALMAVWARREDLRDDKRAETFSLEDNHLTDEGHYEITLTTGLCKIAGTTANVYCSIIGDNYETNGRRLSDPFRIRFKRGAEDSFFLTTTKGLGNVNEIKIWHDDSGPNPSWFLCKVVLHDLTQGKSYHFLCNRWLAIEFDDSQIERTLSLATKEELSSFRTVLSSSLKYCFTEHHILLSVIYRPVKSNFTRVQRLSCCLGIIYIITIGAASICRYTYFLSEDDIPFLDATPVLLTSQAIIVGTLISIGIVPLQMLLVFMFRSINRKPKRLVETKGKTCDIDLGAPIDQNQQALRASRFLSDVEFDDIVKWLKDADHSEPKNELHGNAVGENNLGFTESVMTFRTEEEMMEKFVQEDELTSKGLDQKTNITQRSEIALKYIERRTGHGNSTKLEKCLEKRICVERKNRLPYRLVALAWFIMASVIFSASFFAAVISMQLNYRISQMLTASVVVAILLNYFAFEPLKVILYSIIKTFRRKVDKTRNGDVEINITDNETFVNKRLSRSFVPQMTSKSFTKSKKKQELRKQRRLQEMRLCLILKELAFYLMFLGCLAVVGFGQRDAMAYNLVSGIKNIFNRNYAGTIQQVSLVDRFWSRLNTGILKGLSSSATCASSENLITDCATHILGIARLRQLRIKRGTCAVADIARGNLQECNGDYSWSNEDKGRYYPGWLPFNNHVVSSVSQQLTPWYYRTASELHTHPYVAVVKTYAGGGYALELNGTSVGTLNYLQRHKWIDRYTRALFVELSLYNVPTNLFAAINLVTEFIPTNGIVRVDDIKVVQLNEPRDGKYFVILACEFLAMFFLLCFIYRECKKVYRLRKRYLNDPWNWLEVITMVLVGVSCIILILREIQKSISFDYAKPNKANEPFINITPAATLEELFICCLGLLVFFSNLKLLKLMRFNHRIIILCKTLSLAAPALLSFSVVFLFIYFGYASLYYLTIGSYSEDYNSFISTLETLFSTLLGGFEFGIMVRQVSFFGPIFFCSFMIIVVMILMNIFLAIIMDAIATARNDDTLTNGDLHLLDFVLRKITEKFRINIRLCESNNSKCFEGDQADSAILPDTKKQSLQSWPIKIDSPTTHLPHVRVDNELIPDGNTRIHCNPKKVYSSSSSCSRPSPKVKYSDAMNTMESINSNNPCTLGGEEIDVPGTPSSIRSGVSLDFELDVLSSSSESLSIPSTPTLTRKTLKSNRECNFSNSCSTLKLSNSRASVSAPNSPTIPKRPRGSDLRRQVLSNSIGALFESAQKCPELPSKRSDSDSTLGVSSNGFRLPVSAPSSPQFTKRNFRVEPFNCSTVNNLNLETGKKLSNLRASVSAPNSPTIPKRPRGSDLRRQALSNSIGALLESAQKSPELPQRSDNTLTACNRDFRLPVSAPSSPQFTKRGFKGQADGNALPSESVSASSEQGLHGFDSNNTSTTCNSNSLPRRDRALQASDSSPLPDLSRPLYHTHSLSKSAVELQRSGVVKYLESGSSLFERSLKTSSAQSSPYLTKRKLEVSYGSTHSINAIGRYSVPSSPCLMRRSIQSNATSNIASPPQNKLKITSHCSNSDTGNDIFAQSNESFKVTNNGIDNKEDAVNDKMKPTKLRKKRRHLHVEIDGKLKTLIKHFVEVCLDELVADEIVEELMERLMLSCISIH